MTHTRMTGKELLEAYARGTRVFTLLDLSDAQLAYADLSDARFSDSLFDRADLRGINLDRGSLWSCSLQHANVDGATLTNNSLSDTNLEYASLRSANLSHAVLWSANFQYADLEGAVLDHVVLDRTTKFNYSSLERANLAHYKNDLFGYLDKVPKEVPGLLRELQAGHIDGSSYSGECACLAGTCERLYLGIDFSSEDVWSMLDDYRVEHDLRDVPDEVEAGINTLFDLRDSDSPRERWFAGIGKGHTPDNHKVAQITAAWLTEWLQDRKVSA